MKTMKNVIMLLFVMTLSISLSSCDDGGSVPPPEDPNLTLTGTRWTYSDKFEEDGVKLTMDYTITFSSATAVYEVRTTVTEGSNTTTSSSSINYTYTYSDGLVVLTPAEAGMAYLEGVISSNIKMVVTNISTKKEIGTFYKQ